MADKPKSGVVHEQHALWRGQDVRAVSSSEFASRFGHWAFEAQSAPVKVRNNKTGAVLGYFVSAREFSEFVRLRDRLPRAVWAWELDDDLVAELQKPLPDDYPDLDYLMDE
ncbi:MAG TPA: hypothetical protein VEF55_09315 [Candidatus Binatia bacterium]|nr:hypothetical protein [Candidatus Binatia bacterium]